MLIGPTTATAITLGQTSTIAANKNLLAASGTTAFDLSLGSGVFKTTTGTATFGGGINDFTTGYIKLGSGGAHGIYNSAVEVGWIMAPDTGSAMALYGGGIYMSQDRTYTIGAPDKRPLGVYGLDTTTARPTCDSTTRGLMLVVGAAGGASDTMVACMKSAADTYAYRTVFTAP